jgi:hypothetical protein
MKQLAQIVDGVVVNVSVGDTTWHADGWIEYDAANPAFIGGPVIDGTFYPPQPFPSWVPEAGEWVPPAPRPEGSPFDWRWDEDAQEWVSSI